MVADSDVQTLPSEERNVPVVATISRSSLSHYIETLETWTS